MLTNILESRDRRITNILKLGDTLGRSLRENVELFSIEGDRVNYITESGYVIRGVFDDSKDLTLRDIKVQADKIFSDPKAYDKLVKEEVKALVQTLLADNNFVKTNTSFDSVLGMYETKIHFAKTTRRLQEKTERNASFKILSTDEFKKLVEVKDTLVKFLRENKDTILKYQDIQNALNLSRTVSKAFDLPKITIDSLKESKIYSTPKTTNKSVYDIICKQELIKKELLEAKRDFDDVWATNSKINTLLAEIYTKDEDKLLTLIEEVIKEIPYFAIASTKQLKDIFHNAVSINESLSFPDRDINSFVTKLFELKKPYKELIVKILNDKYGINVTNLKDTPSFTNLVETQVVIFDALAKLVPKSSVLKTVLSEVSKSMKGKSGVESIDVNEFLHEAFDAAGFIHDLSEGSMTNYIDFNKVAADLGSIGDILRSLMGSSQGGMPNPQMGAPAANPAMGINGGGPANQMPKQQSMPPQEEMYPSDETMPMNHAEPDGDEMPPSPSNQNPVMAAQGAKAEIGQETGMDQMMGGPDEAEPGMTEMPQDQLVSQVQELEALLNDLKSELGLGGQEEMIPGEEGGMEGDIPPEGSEVPVEGEMDSVEDETGGMPIEKESEGEGDEPPEPKEKGEGKGGFPPKKKEKKGKSPKE